MGAYENPLIKPVETKMAQGIGAFSKGIAAGLQQFDKNVTLHAQQKQKEEALKQKQQQQQKKIIDGILTESNDAFDQMLLTEEEVYNRVSKFDDKKALDIELEKPYTVARDQLKILAEKAQAGDISISDFENEVNNRIREAQEYTQNLQTVWGTNQVDYNNAWQLATQGGQSEGSLITIPGAPWASGDIIDFYNDTRQGKFKNIKVNVDATSADPFNVKITYKEGQGVTSVAGGPSQGGGVPSGTPTTGVWKDVPIGAIASVSNDNLIFPTVKNPSATNGPVKTGAKGIAGVTEQKFLTTKTTWNPQLNMYQVDNVIDQQAVVDEVMKNPNKYYPGLGLGPNQKLSIDAYGYYQHYHGNTVGRSGNSSQQGSATVPQLTEDEIKRKLITSMVEQNLTQMNIQNSTLRKKSPNYQRDPKTGMILNANERDVMDNIDMDVKRFNHLFSDYATGIIDPMKQSIKDGQIETVIKGERLYDKASGKGGTITDIKIKDGRNLRNS